MDVRFSIYFNKTFLYNDTIFIPKYIYIRDSRLFQIVIQINVYNIICYKY